MTALIPVTSALLYPLLRGWREPLAHTLEPELEQAGHTRHGITSWSLRSE